MIELKTQRLILRNGERQRPSLEQLKKGHQKYVTEHEDPSCSFEDYQDEVIFSFLNAKRGSQFGYFGILPTAIKTDVGHCNFFPRLCSSEVVELFCESGRAALEVEIGWSVHKTQRGKGFATEAAKRLVEYGLGELNLPRILAFTVAKNKASIRVMEKVGMQVLEQQTDRGSIVGLIEP